MSESRTVGHDARDAVPLRESSRPILEIRGVSKTYNSASSSGVRALEPVDLTIMPGEFISFVGPSGCGKSTLLNIIAHLLEPTTGTIAIEGVEQRTPSREVGFMFQAPVLLPWRTVEQNVLLPADIFGIARKDILGKAREVLARVELGDFTKAYPKQLSGGMQQRVALARVLTYEPKILLMDEPFGALDEFTREAMNLELIRITRNAGITVVFVTHNIQEAVFLADRVVVMSPRPGRVSGVVDIPFGPTREIDLMHSSTFTDLTFEVRSILKGD